MAARERVRAVSVSTMRIVLASTSPRRADLLRSVGLTFDVVDPQVDESRFPEEEPEKYVVRLARAKAESVAEPGCVTIAADTTVVFRGQILGKPSHLEEARGMLRRISGEVHTVYTGVAVAGFDESTLRIEADVDRALVSMIELTPAEIAAYAETGEPMDKAGGYALQGLGGVFIDRIEGSPSNVVGLPLHVTARLLRAFGIEVPPRIKE